MYKDTKEAISVACDAHKKDMQLLQEVAFEQGQDFGWRVTKGYTELFARFLNYCDYGTHQFRPGENDWIKTFDEADHNAWNYVLKASRDFQKLWPESGGVCAPEGVGDESTPNERVSQEMNEML